MFWRSSAIDSSGWISMSTPASADTPPVGGGEPAQVTTGLAEFRGVGAPPAKSSELSSVSTHPSVRTAAVVLLRADAAAAPRSRSPTRTRPGRQRARWTSSRGVEPQLRAVAFRTSATLLLRWPGSSSRSRPAVGARHPAPADASWTRRGAPAAGAGERRDLPGRCGRRRVLDRPRAEVDGGASPVEELDEVVGVGRAAVTAAGVDLADQHVGGGALRGWRDQQRCTE